MRAVVHWDADRFFASIEQAADRRLRRRPVAIGGASRGVVLSASQEARRWGVTPGMAMTRARRLCRALIVLPPHFDLYEQFFHNIVGLCEESTPLVEPVAMGAAWLDLTGTRSLLRAGPELVVERLRRTVGSWLRVSLSAGIATNKTVARIAARLRKPGRQVEVEPGGEARFLAPLPLGWLPGVGTETLATLQVAGLATVGELAHAPLDALEVILRRRSLPLQRLAQGVDEEPVRPPKAVDPRWRETHQFAEDAWEEALILGELRAMLERLMGRVRAAGVEARRLTLALRYTDREESERSLSADEPTSLEAAFDPQLPALLRAAWSRRVRLRAVSLRISRLYQPAPQLSLFPGSSALDTEKMAALAATIDSLRRVYGEKAVLRGYRLEPLRRPA